MRKKKMFRHPIMKVIELHVVKQLLAGSLTGERNGYLSGGDEDWNAND